MTPAVFCASLAPCPRLYRDEETSCSLLNHRSPRLGVERTKIHPTASMRRAPISMPSSGETKMNATIFSMPGGMSAQVPALATAAPTSPPTSACEEDEGMPYHQVITFQAIAPTSAPN